LVHCNLQMEQDEIHHQTRWNNSRWLSQTPGPA
jgi:hypothetical protein